MTTRALGLAVAVVRGWTRLYTCCLDPEVRARRRAEIESDLWESQQDPSRGGPALSTHILLRLLLGAPHDLCWRVERMEPRAIPARTVGLAALLAAGVAAWWTFDSVAPRPAPRSPGMQIFLGAPHPPPPPPRGSDAAPQRVGGAPIPKVR